MSSKSLHTVMLAKRLFPRCVWYQRNKKKKEIEDVILPSKPLKFQWASLNRIPCKTALMKRSIIPDSFCQICGYNEVTSNHVLLNCGLVDKVWYAIASWYNFLDCIVTSIDDLLKLSDSLPLQPGNRIAILAIFLTSMWCISRHFGWYKITILYLDKIERQNGKS